MVAQMTIPFLGRVSKNGRRIPIAVPQGLKPLHLSALFGTTEVMP
jgi:hypothetical protein